MFEKKLYKFFIVFFVMLNLSSMENPEDVLPTQNINSTNLTVLPDFAAIEFKKFKNYYERYAEETRVSSAKFCENAAITYSQYSNKFKNSTLAYYESFKEGLEDASKKSLNYFNSLKKNILNDQNSENSNNNQLNQNITKDKTLETNSNNNGIGENHQINTTSQNTNNNNFQLPTSSGSDSVNKNSYMSLANDFLTKNSKNITIGGGAIAGVIILYKTVKYIIKNKKYSAVENDNSDSNIHNGK